MAFHFRTLIGVDVSSLFSANVRQTNVVGGRKQELPTVETRLEFVACYVELSFDNSSEDMG